MQYVAHANTPQEFQIQLIEWIKAQIELTGKKAALPNQNANVRNIWTARHNVLRDVAAFVSSIKIEPKKEFSNADQNLDVHPL